MKTLAGVIVTLGFVQLIGATLHYQWSPLYACAYAVYFIGLELYGHYARDDAAYRRRDREARGLCLQCGYDLAGNVSNVCPECGDGDRMDRSMAPYRRPLADVEALSARLARFRDRPFPTEWAKVVNGVGLASLTMRAERALGRLGRLPDLSNFNINYLRSLGEPKSTASALYADLHPLLAEFDRFIPSLPDEARPYFADLRSLVAEAARVAETWWHVDDAAAAAAQPG